MSSEALRVIPDSETNGRVILAYHKKTIYRNKIDEGVNLVCGDCGFIFLHGGSLRTFNLTHTARDNAVSPFIVLQCPECNLFNDTQP